MRWSRSTVLPSLLLAVSLSACRDAATTAPRADISAAPAVPSFMVRVENMSADSTSADFTVDGNGGVFQIGPHAIYFPRNSICDPSTSSYGQREWDKPCTPARKRVAIHAELKSANGKTWVDFSPSLRFVPDSRPDHWVYLWMRVDAAYNPSTDDALKILWMAAPGQPGIDESLDDPTLATQYLTNYHIVYRRIKHFSGYMVSMGFIDTTTQTLEGAL